MLLFFETRLQIFRVRLPMRKLVGSVNIMSVCSLINKSNFSYFVTLNKTVLYTTDTQSLVDALSLSMFVSVMFSQTRTCTQPVSVNAASQLCTMSVLHASVL